MLIILAVGLYRYSEEQGDQPGRSGETVIVSQATNERPAILLSDADILTGPENPIIPWLKGLSPMASLLNNNHIDAATLHGPISLGSKPAGQNVAAL